MLLLSFLLFVPGLETLFPHPFLRRDIKAFHIVLMGVCPSPPILGAGVEGSVSIACTHVYSVLCCQICILQHSPVLPLHNLPLYTQTHVLTLFFTCLSVDGGFCLAFPTQAVHTNALPHASSLTLCKPCHTFACQSDIWSPPLPNIYQQTSPHHFLYSHINVPTDIFLPTPSLIHLSKLPGFQS